MHKFLGSHKSPTSPSTPSPTSKKGRPPPDMDRQRKLAAAIPSPDAWIREATLALFDADTIFMFSRPPPAHAGIAALEGLHGGAWTKEETALADALSRTKGDLQSSIGRARQCLLDGEKKGTEAFREDARSTTGMYEEMLRAWERYRGKKGEIWFQRIAEKTGGVLGSALGIAM